MLRAFPVRQFRVEQAVDGVDLAGRGPAGEFVDARLGDEQLAGLLVEPFVCFASMFVRQVRQCFSVVWADGFPRCRHRFPVM